MCGRYVLTLSAAEMESFFGVIPRGIFLKPRYNIAPTTRVPVVRNSEEKKEFVEMRWGLIPGWAKPGANLPLMINARAETVVEKPSYRSAFKSRRCVVPATGYYEWLSTVTGKQPYFISRTDRHPILFAGLWEYPLANAGVPSVTIVTTDANADTAKIHQRMPVILEGDAWSAWMDETSGTAKRLLKPSPMGTLIHRPVTTEVNSIKNQGDHLIREYVVPEQFSLFDQLNPL